MTCRFNGVHGVKAVFAKLLLQLHKVTLDKRGLVLQLRLGRVLVGTIHLVGIVVDTDNGHTGKASDFTRRATDTTADVEHAHAWTQIHPVR